MVHRIRASLLVWPSPGRDVRAHPCGPRLQEQAAVCGQELSAHASRRCHHRTQDPESVRTIVIPSLLVDEVIDFMKCIPDLRDSDRLVPATRSFLHHEMDRRSKAAWVKRIRIHDLRHGHVSLLIELGYSALAIADRLGHESTEVTCAMHTSSRTSKKTRRMTWKSNGEQAYLRSMPPNQ